MTHPSDAFAASAGYRDWAEACAAMAAGSLVIGLVPSAGDAAGALSWSTVVACALDEGFTIHLIGGGRAVVGLEKHMLPEFEAHMQRVGAQLDADLRLLAKRRATVGGSGRTGLLGMTTGGSMTINGRTAQFGPGAVYIAPQPQPGHVIPELRPYLLGDAPDPDEAIKPADPDFH